MAGAPGSSFVKTLVLSPEQDADSELDQARFRESIQAVHARLRSFLLTLTSNPDDAEDVLQEAYIIAWKKFSEFQVGTNFYQWVSRIAFHEARNFNRKRRKHRGIGLSDQLVVDLAKRHSGCGELLEMRRDQLHHCLDKLKPADRSLLLDSYRQSSPRAELAQDYGATTGSLYKKLSILRSKLYDCVNRHLGLGERAS